MQYVNNDMDEQFRRAAEDYPLDTGSMDWNRVLSALEEDQPKAIEKRDDRKNRFLWLLLLLPLFFVCNRFGMQTAGVRGEGKNANTEHNTKEKSVLTYKQKRNDNPTGNEISNETVRQENTNAVLNERLKNGVSSAQIKNADKGNKINNGFMPWQGNNNVKSNPEKREQNRARIKIAKIPAMAAGEDASLLLHHRSVAEYNDESLMGDPVEKGTSQTSSIALGNRVMLPALKEVFDHNDISGETPKLTTVSKTRKFYAGAFGGGDVTTIRFQEAKRAGYGAGIAAGYRLNQKWSIELAASSETKFYYSDGRYLDPKKVYQAPNSKITEAEGSCRMLDLSIGGLYNLRKKNGGNWFIGGGLSSYIMKREDYAYTYYYYQSGASHVYEKEYRKATNNLASVANLSIGYRQYFGKTWQFRVEPFVKVPLKGLGYVNLPFMSAGLRAGIYKDLF